MSLKALFPGVQGLHWTAKGCMDPKWLRTLPQDFPGSWFCVQLQGWADVSPKAAGMAATGWPVPRAEPVQCLNHCGESCFSQEETGPGTAADLPQGLQLASGELGVQTLTLEFNPPNRSDHLSFSEPWAVAHLRALQDDFALVPLTHWHPSQSPDVLADFCKCRLMGPTPSVSDSVGLGWGLRICISSRFPGDVDAWCPRPTTLGEPLLAMLHEIMFGLTPF